MPDIHLTPSVIEERFIEAAEVMKRLPEVRVPGYFNTWPKMVVEFADRVGQNRRGCGCLHLRRMRSAAWRRR